MFRAIAVILHGPLLVCKGPSGRGCEGLLACMWNMGQWCGAVNNGRLNSCFWGATKDRNLAVELMRS